MWFNEILTSFVRLWVGIIPSGIILALFFAQCPMFTKEHFNLDDVKDCSKHFWEHYYAVLRDISFNFDNNRDMHYAYKKVADMAIRVTESECKFNAQYNRYRGYGYNGNYEEVDYESASGEYVPATLFLFAGTMGVNYILYTYSLSLWQRALGNGITIVILMIFAYIANRLYKKRRDCKYYTTRENLESLLKESKPLLSGAPDDVAVNSKYLSLLYEESERIAKAYDACGSILHGYINIASKRQWQYGIILLLIVVIMVLFLVVLPFSTS